ncbi:DUF4136 domain-containing protein [Paraburkholderia phymatum]|uniref:Putative transmembrane lipoprotein n=1 Tax=Paraburkholderia phymatum (strain DSM 17167 / CIP 108236 / LMG 21445 / STM815) TaxID=391038 RepID=B2JEJ9_PARP8|nr:DUF4136 domain-containing protein [Paraburkholderia phymatum]ACC69876.1 putative transmembrane lipoprotein [Paraburkholderia phymatum STM815]
MKLDRLTRHAATVLAALAMLLAGCTTYVTTQVTAFSDWSGSDATRTYAFTRTQDQKNNLEQDTYEQIVANELALHAFRQTGERDAHYLVALAYGMRPDTVIVAQPVYYNPWPGPYYWGRPFDPWGPWGPWGPYPTGYVNQSYPVYTHLLAIRITDRATGKEMYNVTARNTDEQSSLIAAMPFLARSAMSDFPLANGAVRTVKLPVDGKGGLSNEVAADSPAPSVPASGAKTVQ